MTAWQVVAVSRGMPASQSFDAGAVVERAAARRTARSRAWVPARMQRRPPAGGRMQTQLLGSAPASRNAGGIGISPSTVTGVACRSGHLLARRLYPRDGGVQGEYRFSRATDAGAVGGQRVPRQVGGCRWRKSRQSMKPGGDSAADGTSIAGPNGMSAAVARPSLAWAGQHLVSSRAHRCLHFLAAA